MEASTEKFENLSYRELQKAAKSRHLNAGGKKKEILRRLLQNENAVPTSKTSSSSHRSPSGKENDTHAVPRKTRTMVSSGASPHLVKKALGQISLNSPRVNQRMVPHKKKPLFSPAAAATATAAAKKKEAYNVESFAAAEAPSASASVPGLQMSPVVSPSVSGVAMKEKNSASGERNSAKAASMDEEVGSRVAAVVPGRSSMTAVTANPRLEEVSALPPGTVVSVKLFTEDKGEQCGQETLEEKPATVADATIDKVVGLSVAAAAPALAADVAGVSVCKQFTDQPQQQQKGEGGDVDEALAKGLPRAVNSSLQQEENTPSVDKQHDQTVLAVVEKETVEEASRSNVIAAATAMAMVPSTEPASGNAQDHETLASTHRLKEGQEKTVAALVATEGQDWPQRKNESTTKGTGAPVVMVAEKENVMVMEKEQENHFVGDASASSPRPEAEGDAALISPTKGKGAIISMSPSPPDKEDDIARMLQAKEVAVVADDSAKVIAKGGAGAGAAVVHGVAAGTERGEGKVVASDMAQLSGLVVDEETKTLVEGSKHLQFEEDERIVRCTLTGKKLAPDYVGILNYITSRRVQQLMVEGPFFMSDYEGMFLVEDPADKGFVFCQLTGMRMFKSKAAVDQHVDGEPFQEMMALTRAKFDG